MFVNLKYIKALRAYHGLSQTNIANTLGCTFATYNKKENGKVDFTLEELNVLAKKFNIPAINFFKDEVSILETSLND